MSNVTISDRPIAVSVNRAAAMVGVSRWMIRRCINRGELQIAKLGQRTLIPVASLEQLIQQSTVSK